MTLMPTSVNNEGSGMTAKVIVLGDDGSEGAQRAWQWLMLHRWPGWTLDVVTAAEVFDSGLMVTSDAPLKEWNPPSARAVDPRSEISGVRHLTKVGDPRAVLDDCDYATLLVVGAVGLGTFKTMLVGSTADWLLHQPPASLALVRLAQPTHSVLVCVDGSAHSQRAVEVLASLPWANDARTQVLSVDDGRTDSRAALQAASGLLRTAGLEHTTTSATGRPTRVILDVLDRWDGPPPLVVLGTRGLTTLRRMWIGSTAAAITRHSRGNVIVASA